MSKKRMVLDQDEQAIESALNVNALKATPRAKLAKYARTARDQIEKEKKDARINLRLQSADLDNLRAEANRKGIPYQTLMASVLHQYATKQLYTKEALELMVRLGVPGPDSDEVSAEFTREVRTKKRA